MPQNPRLQIESHHGQVRCRHWKVHLGHVDAAPCLEHALLYISLRVHLKDDQWVPWKIFFEGFLRVYVIPSDNTVPEGVDIFINASQGIK